MAVILYTVYAVDEILLGGGIGSAGNAARVVSMRNVRENPMGKVYPRHIGNDNVNQCMFTVITTVLYKYNTLISN